MQRLQVAGCLAYLEVSLSVCHGHSQVRDNAQSHHSAQAGRTPRACCIVANQVQLAVPGYCRIRPRWQGSQWQWQSHQRTGLPLGWCPYYSAKNVLLRTILVKNSILFHLNALFDAFMI